MDEVQLMVMAKVDEWRLQRRAAWKIVEGHRGTRDMPAIYDFYGLPFDDEVREQEEQEMNDMMSEAQRIYQAAVASGYFNSDN